ncbi:flavodoxin [uncultured Methanobrevibacter sp.]|uniref:flavodoxin n=1 Tax=uncultured Methanobrevibacter sp. TaxID=253161 RepID=UPI00262ABF92|nr:flavodoxin [uncultured Methanobrevibacter sp.]
MKKLIVYFSYTGNTRMIANKIKEKLNCDILEIETTIPYSSDYDEVVNDEQNGEASNHLPEIKKLNINLDEYDVIILGTPVWWYRPCPAIRTFLTENDLDGKTIIPFATNAGWLGKTFDEIKEICPNSGVEYEMDIIFESYSDKLKTNNNEINAWIDKIEKIN